LRDPHRAAAAEEFFRGPLEFWRKAPCSDAKTMCRSDNTSLPQQVHHQGHQIIHVAIHEAGYWLIGGHNTVARELNKCVTCKKLRGPVIEQCMADLPAVRMEVASLHKCWVQHFWSLDDTFSEDTWRCSQLQTLGTGSHLPKESIEASSFICTLQRFFAPSGPFSILRYDWGTDFIGR